MAAPVSRSHRVMMRDSGRRIGAPQDRFGRRTVGSERVLLCCGLATGTAVSGWLCSGSASFVGATSNAALPPEFRRDTGYGARRTSALGVGHRRSLSARRADIGGGVDFAIIRFKIPGFDDLTMLPRVIASIALALLVANRFYFPTTMSGDTERILSEVLSLILAVCCAVLPFWGRRLEEAARRQVSTRQASQQLGSLQTLAIDASLPPAARLELSWTTSSLLRFTNADGLVAWMDGRVVCTRGLLKQLPGFARGAPAVLSTLGDRWQPSTAIDGYCATRNALGKFPAGVLPECILPSDAEAVVIKPLPGNGCLVLWSGLPRAFDRAADRQWVAQVARKIGSALPHPVTAPASSGVTSETCYEQSFPLLGDVNEEAEAASRDPFARFDQQVRVSPGVVGLGALGVLGANRVSLVGQVENLIRGIDPAQSRADLLGGTLAITLVLQSMVWLSETPADPEIEDVKAWEGVEDVMKLADKVSGTAAEEELSWAWGALSACTRSSSMAVFWTGDEGNLECVMQGGYFRRADAGGIPPQSGGLCEEVMSTGKGRYLAQLKNYPAKEQFLGFLPERTQGLVLTPLRPAPDAPPSGVMALGIDAIRGVGRIDQAWIAALAEKLAVTLAELSQRRNPAQ